MSVYILVSGDAGTNIFADGASATVAGTQINAAILGAWTDAELAELGLVRALVVVPQIDPDVAVLTGAYDAVQVDGTWQWVAQTRALTIDELVAIKRAGIAANLAKALGAGMDWVAADGKTYRVQTDSDSLDNIAQAATGAANGTLPADFVWRMADNTPVALDAAGVKALSAAAGARKYACLQAAWTLKDQLATLAATPDPAAISAIDPTAGWPA